MSQSEEEQALETQEVGSRAPAIVSRGDSFDIGNQGSAVQNPQIINILQNPNALAQLLNINADQAENIRAAIVGGGAGLSTKYLSKHFGSPIAGAFGGFLAGLLADKVFKK